MILVPLTGNAFEDTDLYHVYKFDESSGTVNDEVGTFDLTDNNTVGSHATCLDNGCRDLLSASTEYFNWSGTGLEDPPYTITGWVRFDTLPGNGTDYGLLTSTDSSLDKYISLAYIGSAGTKYWVVNGDGTVVDTSISTNTWYFVTIINTGTVSQLLINNEWKTQYANVSTSNLSTDKLVFGVTADTAGTPYSGRYLNGDLEEWYMWDSQLSSTSITDLYNSGSGLFYPYTVSTTSTTTTSTTTSTVDVEELKWVLELYLSVFTFLIFTYLGYRFTKMFI